MIPLTIALAVFVGVSLGLLGGGGSILMVPLLAYVGGFEPKTAIAMSLLVVGVTSAIAAVGHARAGRVRWRVAIIFGLVAMAGAYVGGRLATFVPDAVLLVAFAVIMVAAGIAMLRGRRDCAPDAPERSLPIVKIALLGIVVGLISGLVGAGGGFLLVPALALVGGLAMPLAVGTSLVIIAMQSFAGFAGHLASQHIDWRIAGFITAAAVIGALLGGRLVSRVNPETLRRLFGWFVLLMAALILAEEVGVAVGAVAAGVTVLAAAMSAVCARYGNCPWRRLDRRAPAPTG